jgi:hypothetical protein
MKANSVLRSTLPNAILAVLESRKRVKPRCGSLPQMTISDQRALHLPHMRANPFSARPIEVDGAAMLVGRKTVMQDLSLHLRFRNPRLMVLQGERGSGRTSVLHACANLSPEVLTNTMFPEQDPVATLLSELYIRIAGYEVPATTGMLVEQMVASLEGRSGDLPLITFDFPGVGGEELAQVFERLTPCLCRLKAIVVVALTPAQLAAWSEDLISSYDVTVPLPDLNAKEVRALIDARMRTVSHEGWAASDALIDEALAATGGRPAGLIRHFRDLIDAQRGASTPLTRRLETMESMDLGPHDAKQRMAPEPVELEDEIEEEVEVEIEEQVEEEVEEEIETEPDIDFHWDIPDLEPEPEPDSEPEFPDEPEEIVESSPSLPELEVEQTEEPDMDQAFGGAILQMEPGTEPPPPREPPAARGGPFAGLKRRQEETNREIGIDDALRTPSSVGPMEAKPDTTLQLPLEEPSMDSEETTLWVNEELPRPVMNPIAAKEIGANLRRETPPAPTLTTPPLDMGRITALNEGEIAIVEAAIAREISPSDAALQAFLAVGRPRLSQIYNGLHKAGILAVRKQGRSRLFRISDAAKAHLSGGHMEG